MDMDSSFTEHVLERARARQKKLAPLREANFGASHSNPNLSDTVPVKTRKEVVSDPTICQSPRQLLKQNSKTMISSCVAGSGSPKGEVNTLNIQRDSFNMEIKYCSADNVRLEVEIESDSDTDINATKRSLSDDGITRNEGSSGGGSAALRDSAKDRLIRLGKLYAGGEDLSSPIHRTENKFIIEDDQSQKENKAVQNSSRPKMGLGKLAALAEDRNHWEDDISHKKVEVSEKKKETRKKSWKPPAPQPPSSPVKIISHKTKTPAPKAPIGPSKAHISTPTKQDVVAEETKSKGTPKQLKWDKEVLDTLEKSATPPTIHENTEANSEETEQVITTKKFVALPVEKDEQLNTPRSPTKHRSNKIANRAALFEQVKSASPIKKEKDPALLSVSERMALFEKNRGAALLPKAAFGMSAPIKASTSTPNDLSDAAAKKHEKTNKPISIENSSVAEKIAQLNRNKTTISQEQIENKVKEERQKEMEILMNRFNHNKKVQEETEIESDEDDEHEVTESTAMISGKSVKIMPKYSGNLQPTPSTEDKKSGEKRASKGDSPQVQAILGDVKRIKVTQPKDGKLYPCLSDIEAATETETEHTATPSPNNSLLEDSFCDSEANTSFGREILQAVCNNTSAKKVVVASDSSESDVSDVLEDMDEYLNEYEDTDSPGPTPPKHGKIISPKKGKLTEPSQSFNYKSCSPKKTTPQKFNSPCKIITSPRRRDSGDLPTHVVDGTDVLPLTYTVSFYRKQQTQGATPVRQVTRQPIVEENTAESIEAVAVKEQIAKLTDEINKQQMVISQTSRALNLCNSTPEFTGSTEQVEAEKVLLLATHRRQAACMEIQRLKVEGTLRPLGPHKGPLEKGTLYINNIVLPLKKEYVRALAAAGGKGHHVVCLVKSGEQVVCTPLVSTVASSSRNPDLELEIPGKVCLKNIYSDFTVAFEVYCLQAQEEILPHEVKYHIGKKNASKLTPKKGKMDSRMVRPPKESPAGPQAVRSPTFALNGYVIFSIQALNKTNWTLNQTPPISPLEGSITMRLHCELEVSVEHRGFLSMFEDLSGLGAWHRRWCLVKGCIISYWKYPEDECKKAPIDTIDLRSCITETVGPVSRDVCARLNTFLVERERASQPNDKETLTVICKNDKTIIKHLLSADTKEERIQWCECLNKALRSIRMCGSKE